MFKKALTLIGIATLLASCATTTPQDTAMSATDCQNFNVMQQGELDGRAGKPNTAFGQYRTACLVHDIKLANHQYLNGWIRGNRHFCSQHHLYKMGSSGEDFPAVCPHTESSNRAFRHGSTVKNRINRISNEIQSVDKQLMQIEDLEKQMNILKDNEERVQNDLEFFKAGVVHDEKADELVNIKQQEKQLKQRMSSQDNRKARATRHALLKRKTVLAHKLRRLRAIA